MSRPAAPADAAAARPPRATPSRIDLGRVVDLAGALESDEAFDPENRRRRDRRLGLELGSRVSDVTARVDAWLDHQQQAHPTTTGHRVVRAQRTLRALLAVVGLASGAGASLAFYAYDGGHPVNVVQVLAFFVALQALLLCATALLALPEAWRRRVPGLAALQDVLRLASPGRWEPALRRVLAPAQRQALERVSGLATRHARLFGDADKWGWLATSQFFAVAFHVGAIAAAVVLVTFSDLAFGWSTTLDVDAGWLHRVVTTLAQPWSGLFPDAVPTRALIEETQYFRGAGAAGRSGAGDPLGSAAWWQFLLACMISYGLLPRVLFSVFAGWRQRVALTRVFRSLPGVADLEDRLASRLVETAAHEDEGEGAGRASATRPPRLPRPEQVQAVLWSGLALPEAEARALLRDTLDTEVSAFWKGGAGSELSDAALQQRLSEIGGATVWLVKAWEPPLLEVLDLFAGLRETLAADAAIFVLPLELEDEQWRLASGDHARTWRRRFDRAGDPWLEVVTAEAAS